MRSVCFLLVVLSCNLLYTHVSAGQAACRNPYYGKCYGIPLACPPACPRLCEVDCKLCKPYCDCDKPGAVCQDPRFIGGDGITFYFHGRKDKDFCLVADTDIHINAHFIGKKSKKGRDFTWVQAVGILFDRHQLYIGAKKVAEWHNTDDNLHVQLNGTDINIPSGEGKTWWASEHRLRIERAAEENAVVVEVVGLFKMRVRVVPITGEESRVHGYDITKEDCFAHLELGFKFSSLSTGVSGVLGQTYAPKYRSRVKIGAAMPIMGGEEKFKSSHLFSTDCAVSRFRLGDRVELEKPSEVECGGGGSGGGKGIVCRR